MDLEASSHQLLASENVNPDDPTMSPGTAEQQRRRAVALKQGQPERSKILSFQQKPSAHEGVHSKYESLSNNHLWYCEKIQELLEHKLSKFKVYE